MKKRLTRGEKWFFVASPLLLLIIAGLIWQQKRTAPYSIEVLEGKTVDALRFSPDGKRILLFPNADDTPDNTIGEIYDLEARTKVCELAKPEVLPGQWDEFYCDWPVWSPDGKYIAGGMMNVSNTTTAMSVVIWDARYGMVRAATRCKPSEMSWAKNFVRYSSDGKTLIGGDALHVVYDAKTAQRLKVTSQSGRQSAEGQSKTALGLSAIKSDDGKQLRVVDLKSKRVLWQTSLGYSPRTKWFGEILCLRDVLLENGNTTSRNRLILWNGKTRQLMPSPSIPADEYFDIYGFNPDKTVFSYYQWQTDSIGDGTDDENGKLTVWDYQNNRLLWSSIIGLPILRFDWSPDGKWLFVLAYSTTETYNLYVFDKSGKLHLNQKPIGENIEWSPDSKHLATVVMKYDEVRNAIPARVDIHRFAEE